MTACRSALFLVLAVYPALKSPTCPNTIYKLNTAFTFSQPTPVGGVPNTYAYSIGSGALPTGLSINATIGVISGTPSVSGQSFNYTISLKDGSGVTTVSVPCRGNGKS